MSAPPTKKCRHDPLPDLTGRIVSPRMHYGDGADGMIDCLRCGKWFKGIEALAKDLERRD